MSIDKAIDPARVGISKSLVVTPCERKGLYSETVRDESGRRLRFPMPERVIFGQAVDSAHSAIVDAAREGRHYSVAMGVSAGMLRLDSPTSEHIDADLFETQLALALTKFLNEPDGLARIPLEGIRIQGDDGESLAWDGLVGTPDYILGDGSILDVKTAARSYPADKAWKSAEMPFYALLATGWNGGTIPPRLIYQTYVRSAKPYWQWLEWPGTADLVAIGAEYVAHWRALLAAGDVDLATPNTAFCGDCPWRESMREYGHSGCRVGSRMPRVEVEA